MKLTLPQILAVGYYDTDVSLKGVSVTKERKTVIFELELPVERGGVSYIDSEQCEIKADMMICAKPGQIRHTKTPYKAYFIHLAEDDGEFCAKLKKLPSFVKSERYDSYYAIFHKLYIDYQLGAEGFVIYRNLLNLVHMLFEDSEKGVKKSSSGGDNIVSEAIFYIQKNLGERLTLEKISQKYGYAPTYFHKIFKLKTGKTLRDYIEEQRIEKAKILLNETDCTISQIAYECGFSSQSYFNYAFKRRTKKTPGQYARRG